MGGRWLRCEGCGARTFVRAVDVVARCRSGCRSCAGTLSSDIAKTEIERSLEIELGHLEAAYPGADTEPDWVRGTEADRG